ncbi:UDP-N-acetylmuramoylalanine--D-glutamate ligase [Methanobrevibacter cuticularis]|uniref:UDP-N-acetylmuramoylalanine--D-glutamate ligase n=1 Tax=Methanobrevibacter cuticularis TaxID=47311 RepID=A0A166FBS4_9EURY|nr:Mur ligase family protein [Methanobrevibacter cuticularis]KZX17510.1 UDP-N-acetylmuramoylalanine--D-glutamate ligase [Methanobrevibacter cuticularis]
MKAAVVGLGVEGIKATKALLDYGWKVYATDLQTEIDLEELKISISDAKISTYDEKINISTNNLTIDLGYLDECEIDSSDAIVISPSLCNTKIAKKALSSGKLLSDILDKHKEIFTIGITGTNGKTTTSLILKEILENAGKKILIGGNAGGGFEGYYDLILKAEKGNYDIIIIEVCDMTLEFCDYAFNFDLVGLTNIGNDHIDVHGSIENYKNSLLNFSKNKTTFIDKNQIYLKEFKESNQINELVEYDESNYDLKLFGKFNRLNAGLATAIAKVLDVEDFIIKNTLGNFEPVEGRLKEFKLNDSKIYIGKTDNSDAVKSILNEKYFYATFIGTPRSNEEHRFEILDTVASHNPEIIVLFPGLEDTVEFGLYRLKSIGYEGRIEIANNLDEIISLLAEYSHEDAIFIGGNGQKNIIEIQDRLELLTKNCN